MPVARCFFLLLILLMTLAAAGQDTGVSIDSKQLPKGSLWNPYSFQFHATGGLEPYNWERRGGQLPKGLRIESDGKLVGTPEESGQFTLIIAVAGKTGAPLQQELMLEIEAPLTVAWDQRAHVNGQRIDGSVKASNTTGRDLDLTFVVLAVNDIGRATAIGYQHFPLKANSRDMRIPFGETLSPGNYAIHADAVGEEPVSNKIFRSRLVVEKQSITQGP